MADDQFSTNGNWWDSARNRYCSGASQSSSSGLTTVANFAWQPDMVDTKSRSSMDSMSMSGNSFMIFDDNRKPQTSDSAASSNPNLHMMALDLSNQQLEWNRPALLHGEKPAPESNFRSRPQQDNLTSSNTNFQQETGIGLSQIQWREKLLCSGCNSESSTNELKQVNSGFSLNQPRQLSPQYSSGDRTIICQGLPSSFQVESSPLYGNPSIPPGLLRPDNNQTQQPSINLPYPASYGFNDSSDLVPSWSKVPQILRSSPPKRAPHNQLSFTNNTPFWNISETLIKDVRPSYFPSSQSLFCMPSFDDPQSKNISSEVRDSSAFVKKSGNTETSKRPRNETASPIPGSKMIRKEKMGDRITALQQLVSPFGKTDTASVLSEAIEYIKFLHEQVTLLSSPYMKSGGSMQHQQQNSGKSKEADVPKQDLRSRGLCLVPVSSTFPVTHETAADYWTPTFGGTFR